MATRTAAILATVVRTANANMAMTGRLDRAALAPSRHHRACPGGAMTGRLDRAGAACPFPPPPGLSRWSGDWAASDKSGDGNSLVHLAGQSPRPTGTSPVAAGERARDCIL